MNFGTEGAVRKAQARAKAAAWVNVKHNPSPYYNPGLRIRFDLGFVNVPFRHECTHTTFPCLHSMFSAFDQQPRMPDRATKADKTCRVRSIDHHAVPIHD